MALDSLDKVVAGVAAGATGTFYKTGPATTGAGALWSLWAYGAFPPGGSNPTAVSVYTDQAFGALPIRQYFSSASGVGNIYQFNAVGATINQWFLYDRLMATGSHAANVTTLYSVNMYLSTMADTGRCVSSGSDVDWFFEIYADLGVTQFSSTVQYITSDGVARSQNVSVGGASPLNRAGRLYQIPPRDGMYIAAVISSKQITANAAAGNYGVTCMKRLCFAPQMVANVAGPGDWASIGLPTIMATSCLQLVAMASTTSIGAMMAFIKIAPTP